ncbi:hypothetical protein [uncultured Pseudokineococcus sp.]|uniref:hypothetical protein n=1 Tax=uncultured Pseudokineococcus sp. TaxID=1642928 RepID=UPI0026070000|nr:hypothetical protein [uncultured Pseudokineococcus sp.]
MAWLVRDQSGEVDVTVIFAGIPLLLMAFPWSIAFLVGAPFMSMVALAWANVGVHYLLARLLDRRLPG